MGHHLSKVSGLAVRDSRILLAVLDSFGQIATNRLRLNPLLRCLSLDAYTL